jgi:pyruvate,water dikinase
MEPECLTQSKEGRKLLEHFDIFIQKYGHREGSSWYLTTPTWRQNPNQVWKILASLVGSESRTGNPTQARARRIAAFSLVEKRLHFLPCLPNIFRWLRYRLYRMNVFREKSHYDLTRPLDALQEITKEWAHRLSDRGVLEHESDVGFLSYDEIRDWLCEIPPKPGEARRLIASRRATYRLVNSAWQTEREGVSRSGKKLKGIPASPGRVRGKVRTIHGEHEFDKLVAGEVLVSPYTNPAWTPLFSVAAAVITETGGASSHAAIVAREYRIPAVMAISGVTQILKDGQDVLVDGDRGLVLQ